jgi:hypothetical protein
MKASMPPQLICCVRPSLLPLMQVILFWRGVSAHHQSNNCSYRLKITLIVRR